MKLLNPYSLVERFSVFIRGKSRVTFLNFEATKPLASVIVPKYLVTFESVDLFHCRYKSDST